MSKLLSNKKLDALSDDATFSELKSIGLEKIEQNQRILRYIYKRGLGEDLFGVIRSVAIRAGMSPSLLGLLYSEWSKIHRRYNKFQIPKKSGGQRTILTPDDMLKAVQRAIYDRILDKVPLHKNCHGFRKGCSTGSNAAPHIGKDVVVNIDLKDFFPSVTAARVYGIFKSIGMGNNESRFLTRLTTYREKLPQGAPTSPALANLACRRLDSRLSGLAKKIGCRYTRYADDLTFSGKEKIVSAMPKIREIINEEGFRISPKKFRIIRSGKRQEVTGLVVNEKVTVPRKIRRLLRAALHRLSIGKRIMWHGKRMKISALRGHIAYISSVQPDLGKKMSKAYRKTLV